ncbi:MAG: hypothetical protein GXN97_06715 [Aquificae bacterium]|nr:hypothetical protein [Aquificota bacterium]
MKLIEVKATDFWLFGGLKNFQAGEDTYREVLFPPDVIKFFHLTDITKCKPVGVFIKQEEELYLPAPADLLRPRKGEPGPLAVATLKEPPAYAITDLETDLLPVAPEVEIEGRKIKYEGASGFIPIKHLKEYLEKGTIEGNSSLIKTVADFVAFEPKVGLTLDFDRFNAQESRLYFTFVVRPKKGTSLAVLFDGNCEGLKGFYHIGGETRVSELKESTFPENLINRKVYVQKGNLYRFYLLTHTFVEGGLEKRKTLKVAGKEFEVVWFFSAGAEWISGFRKPGIKMLKPGGVMVLRALEEGEVDGFTFLEARTLLPVYKDKNSTEVDNEIKDLHLFGWNRGFLAPYNKLREV